MSLVLHMHVTYISYIYNYIYTLTQKTRQIKSKIAKKKGGYLRSGPPPREILVTLVERESLVYGSIVGKTGQGLHVLRLRKMIHSESLTK